MLFIGVCFLFYFFKLSAGNGFSMKRIASTVFGSKFPFLNAACSGSVEQSLCYNSLISSAMFQKCAESEMRKVVVSVHQLPVFYSVEQKIGFVTK